MPHFFIKSTNIKDDIITVADEENLRHLCFSLRVRTGEKLKLVDENENCYLALVEKITKNSLEARILEAKKGFRKLNFNLNLVHGILKPDAEALLISGATQCGVQKIYPVISDNCAAPKNSFSKIEKWQKISDEASKQCERVNLATVEDIATFENVLLGVNKANVIIFAEKYAKYNVDEAIKDVDKNLPIYVVTGPEGGFSEAEFEYFKKQNFKLVTLGNLIFKAPNAVVAGLSNIITRM